MHAKSSVLAAFMSTSLRYRGLPLNSTLVDERLSILLRPAGRWYLSQDGLALERRFRFANFRNTWKFMNVVATESKRLAHHPEWANVYNSVFIRWTTHSPADLTVTDMIMAKFCDEKAEEIGEMKLDMAEDNLSTEKMLIGNLDVVADNSRS